MNTSQLPVGKSNKFLGTYDARGAVLSIVIYTPYSTIHQEAYGFQDALQKLKKLKEQGIEWDSYEITRK